MKYIISLMVIKGLRCGNAALKTFNVLCNEIKA